MGGEGTSRAELLPHEQSSAVQAAIAEHLRRPGALLPILHAIQERLGYIPPAAVQPIAAALNLSRAEVHGVISFYPDFRTTAPGRHVVRVCRAEACQSMNGSAIEAHAKRRLGCDFHETSSDRAYTLEPVYCLGNCAVAPNVMLDGTLHGRMSTAKFDALLVDNASRESKAAAAAASENAITVFVPVDSSALAMGADEVADAIKHEALTRNRSVRVVRNGSRGLFWLEPMVEVATAEGRIAYGPVSRQDVASLFDADFLHGAPHGLRLGRPEDVPYLNKQQRLTFARCGVIDPLSLDDYEAHGGWRGLRAALAMQPAEIVEVVTQSGLRGRGGAAFPTGIKWRTVLSTAADQKYIVCNADEGDSGTFSDRMIMEGDPFVLIEGMIIAGLAVGATEGYVYIRS